MRSRFRFRCGVVVDACDVVVTMGCGDTCPILPGTTYRDWALPDPAGQSIEPIRPIRDDIRARVQALLTELLATTIAGAQRSQATRNAPSGGANFGWQC